MQIIIIIIIIIIIFIVVTIIITIAIINFSKVIIILIILLNSATTSSGNGLLDLMGTTPTSAPSTGQPTSSAPSGDIFSLSSSTPISRPRDILLKHMMGGGLQVEYQFSRSHSDNGLSTVQLFLSNKSTGTLTEITCSVRIVKLYNIILYFLTKPI